MFVMIRSDFITMKSSLLQLFGLCVLIMIFICIGTGTLIAGVAAVCAMIPFMYIFSIVAYDEMNGWERFRLTLPISRKQVVLGRYASIVIVMLLGDALMVVLSGIVIGVLQGLPQMPFDISLIEGYDPVRDAGHVLMISAAMLFATACSMPLFMRFGMTKGTRLAPLLLVLIMVAALFLIGNYEDDIAQMLPALELIFGTEPEGALTALQLGVVIFAVVFVLYIVSALISIKLYEKRQF